MKGACVRQYESTGAADCQLSLYKFPPCSPRQQPGRFSNPITVEFCVGTYSSIQPLGRANARLERDESHRHPHPPPKRVEPDTLGRQDLQARSLTPPHKPWSRNPPEYEENSSRISFVTPAVPTLRRRRQSQNIVNRHRIPTTGRRHARHTAPLLPFGILWSGPVAQGRKSDH